MSIESDAADDASRVVSRPFDPYGLDGPPEMYWPDDDPVEMYGPGPEDTTDPRMPDPGMPDPGMTDPGMPEPGMPDPGMPATGMPAPAVDGPISLQILSVLAGQVPADTSAAGLLDALEAWQRFTGFATSRIWIDLAELHTRFTASARTRLDHAAAAQDQTAGEEAADRFELAERSVVAEIATALSWSGLRAGDQLDIALILTTDLTATLDAVTHGRLEVKKAEAIARALRREDPDLRRLIEAEILKHAAGWTVPHLHDQIRKAVLKAAPELAKERADRARRQRGVSFKAEPDDMVRLEAHLPVEDGILVRAALDHAALDIQATQTHRGPDQRGLDQIRADVLADTLINLDRAGQDPIDSADTDPDDPGDAGDVGDAGDAGDADPVETATAAHKNGAAPAGAAPAGAAPKGSPPTGAGSSGPAKAPRTKRGLRREVVLTVPLETITGDADHPGYLARYGPISAHIARRMALQVAQDGYWRCAVTDDQHGTLLGLGRSTLTPAYRAPEYLQRFVNLRDQTCDFPGCRQPAAACDFEHTIPHPEGSTCECGGANRCGNHHRLKHETAWNVRRSDNPDHPPGSHIWTSPTGREYLSSPATIGVPATPGSETVATSRPAGTRRPGQPDPRAWTYDPSLTELPTATTPPPVQDDVDDDPPPF